VPIRAQSTPSTSARSRRLRLRLLQLATMAGS
jgi:hypothetical protein